MPSIPTVQDAHCALSILKSIIVSNILVLCESVLILAAHLLFRHVLRRDAINDSALLGLPFALPLPLPLPLSFTFTFLRLHTTIDT